MKWSKGPIDLVVCAVSAFCLGCGQPPHVSYYLSSPQSLHRVHRAAFVELSQDGSLPPIAEDMTESLFRAIQAGGFFHIDKIPRSDPLCQDLPLDNRQAFTLKELGEIRERFDCDALLIGRVSHFRSYPRMQIGLLLRLIDLKEGRLIWGIEHIWDTTDKTTEARIKQYFEGHMRSGYEPEEWGLVLKSPKAFQKFVASEVADTLAHASRQQDGRK